MSLLHLLLLESDFWPKQYHTICYLNPHFYPLHNHTDDCLNSIDVYGLLAFLPWVYVRVNTLTDWYFLLSIGSVVFCSLHPSSLTRAPPPRCRFWSWISRNPKSPSILLHNPNNNNNRYQPAEERTPPPPTLPPPRLRFSQWMALMRTTRPTTDVPLCWPRKARRHLLPNQKCDGSTPTACCRRTPLPRRVLTFQRERRTLSKLLRFCGMSWVRSDLNYGKVFLVFWVTEKSRIKSRNSASTDGAFFLYQL